MIIGVDLEKNERVLYDAYNDAAGVTARFNLNVLVRINRELGGNFDVSAFMHRSVYNRERHRIEMHLIAKKAQTVRILGRNFSFRPGESIHTEFELQIQPRPLHRAGARLRLVGAGILDRPRRGCFRFTRWRRQTEERREPCRSRRCSLAGRICRQVLAVACAPAAAGAPGRSAARSNIQSSDNRSAPSSHAWMIRHLSCPRDWKSSSGDPAVLQLVEELQRIFSGGPVRLDRLRQDPAVPLLNDAYSCFTLFHRRVFPATAFPWTLSDRAGQGRMERCYAAARPAPLPYPL